MNRAKHERDCKWTLTSGQKSASANARSKSSTIERHTNVAPAQSSATLSKTNAQQPSSTSNSIGAYPKAEIITRKEAIRRILGRVDWTKLRGDTVQEVATFRELEDAETKFQEFESFIRAEGKYLGLPEGCKPFERVLIQGSKAGSKPCPYIRFTNFRTEEDVRKYHAALSKRKVKSQYHPPLRLCYEIQRLNFLAANAGIHVEEDPGETLCGKTAVIEDGGTRRLVTIGGLIRVDNKLYAMTAGHDATADKQLPSISESEASFDASNDDTEYDDDIEPALICGGPSTTSDDGRQSHQGGKADQRYATPGSATLTFHGSSMSGDDWSLHLIEDPLLALPNSFPVTDDGIERAYMTYPTSQSGYSHTGALLLAGVSGPRVVHMLPGIVSFPLPTGNWVSAWKVSRIAHESFKECILLLIKSKVALHQTAVSDSQSHQLSALQHGDSGSWVVDRVTGKVFGHVIASTDTTAFLIPLIHTLNSISRQAKLKGTGDVTALPPAFDMLADLAHAYHVKFGQRNQERARLFASRAVLSVPMTLSPGSEVAPIIDSFLRSHDYSATIKTILQNLLVRTGADLKGNLASMCRNKNKESLSKVIEDSAPIDKEVTEAAIRNLIIALGNPPEFLGIQETTWGKRLLLPGGKTPESKEQSSHKKPDIESTLVHDMSGALRHSNDWLFGGSDRGLKTLNVKPKFAAQIPESSNPDQHEKYNPGLSEARYAPSSTLYNTQAQTVSQSQPPIASQSQLPPRSEKKKILGLAPLACAGISTIIAALVAAISVLGAFLGVEVQQNKSLQTRISELVDSVPSCKTTTVTFTTSVTASASTDATPSTTNDTTSSSALSPGAIAGISVGVSLFAIMLVTLVLFIWRRKKLRKVTVESPKTTYWDSTTAAYSYAPPTHLMEASQSVYSPPVEMDASYNSSRYPELRPQAPYHGLGSESSMSRSTEQVPPSARVADVLQVPDLNVGLQLREQTKSSPRREHELR